MDDFLCFSKKLGFGAFLVHPTMVSVLLSASVERYLVSRMRDFKMSNTFFVLHVLEQFITITSSSYDIVTAL